MYQMSPVKITTRATNCVQLHTLSRLLGHAVPLQSPCVVQQEEQSSEQSARHTEQNLPSGKHSPTLVMYSGSQNRNV